MKEIEEAGGRALAAVADVTDAPAVQAMAQAALQKFGRIDYLVNNAALRQEKSIEDMTFEDWRHVIGITLDGAFHCVKACLEPIKQSDAGSILNIGGLTGAMGAPDRIHVVTAKAGLAGFTRGLAMELSPHRITVNTLVPAMLARPGKPDEIPPHPIYRPLLGRAGWPTDFAPLTRLPARPRRTLHHRPDHQRQRRHVFQYLRFDGCSGLRYPLPLWERVVRAEGEDRVRG